MGRCGVGWPPPQLESLPPVSTRLLLSQTTLGRSPPAAHTSPRLLPRGASASYTIHGPKTQGILLHQLQPRTDTLSSHHDIAMQQFFLPPNVVVKREGHCSKMSGYYCACWKAVEYSDTFIFCLSVLQTLIVQNSFSDFLPKNLRSNKQNANTTFF